MRKLFAVVVLIGAMVAFGSEAGISAGGGPPAVVLLFNRALPTANLNNAAGASRSNVAWADFETTLDPKTNIPAEYWLPGDDFNIQTAGNYEVTHIRVWIIGDVPTPPKKGKKGAHLTLWGGTYSRGICEISSDYSVTPVTYAGGDSYQGGSGAFSVINQVDFVVDVDVRGGEAFTFFVDGPWTPYSGGGGFVNPFLHSSNGPLSGQPEPGANGYTLYLHRKGPLTVGVEDWNSGDGTGTQCANLGIAPAACTGWDKNSDANVQVFGYKEK